jgi:AmiR/NasT family two-component response regulator
MTDEERYKILLANDDEEELGRLAELVERAGHDVVSLAVSVAEAGDAIVEHRPEMAMVLVHGDEEHALELMVEIRSFAEIPLVVLARTITDETLRQAADHALEVLHLPGDHEAVSQVIGLAAERHLQRTQLERRVGEMSGIIERRSTVERAKGILMERHGIDEVEAFERMRTHARSNQLKVIDVAASIVTARDLLPAPAVAITTGDRETA